MHSHGTLDGTSKYLKPMIPKNFLTIFVFVFVLVSFLKFQISIGQGWGGTARTEGMARRGPSPGQLKFEIWNLKFEFFEIHRIYRAKMAVRRSSDGRPPTIRQPPDEKKISEKQSVSQVIDLVMTINSVQKSSKSELSSTTFGHFKVCVYPG